MVLAFLTGKEAVGFLLGIDVRAEEVSRLTELCLEIGKSLVQAVGSQQLEMVME